MMKPMALTRDAQELKLEPQQGMALLTIRVNNKYKTGYQPYLEYAQLRSDEKRSLTTFTISDVVRDESESNQFEEAVLSFAVAPGRYQLRTVMLHHRTFFTQGACGFIPIYETFEVKPGAVVYLGRLEAVRRERKDDAELRAGPVVPLIDQAVTGFSGGTFDVTIRDAYDQDLAALRKAYPALGKLEVSRAVLPPWHRPSDQEMD
jgi:hypothetical protein